MHVVGDRLDAMRELGGVGLQLALRASLEQVPTAVEIHVFVAGGLHAGRDQRARLGLNSGLAYVA